MVSSLTEPWPWTARDPTIPRALLTLSRQPRFHRLSGQPALSEQRRGLRRGVGVQIWSGARLGSGASAAQLYVYRLSVHSNRYKLFCLLITIILC